ncbi:tRNA wybutosine-synthesizing protein 2 homolog [Microcaecilia unicolor]|uniref:tRNA wybutosine-synthesizing protein 2 homolog n=1 Tax=Microcaecilia unicolor TaxID=1415580 RepID=A0A6P7YQY2_9AMPH|nr:tRNA wybutosine-synthesizing protein 2 homolog [Microcaecilia unicolor]XP_030065548.1 tRNA wybutosine-synthesizing protein 2 homolog [Microcaecilia unicolor]XP_030065549.1 tRNA wybutosine-synthesizing protein 2 homolog [Microcaecilia unicolor]
MEEEEKVDNTVTALVTESLFSELYRKYLERKGILANSYRMQKQADGTVTLPVLEEKLTESILQELMASVAPGSTCAVTQMKNPVLSKRARVQSPAQKLRYELHCLMERYGISWQRELDRDLPHTWQRHGDLIVLNEDCFSAPVWKALGTELWDTVASTLGVQRVAKQGRVSADGLRSPTVTLLLGNSSWVEHVDNGIRYTFDVTKCMFSSGNIREKLRVAGLFCRDEVVVDLYAGIGYFTLPYLVHAGAAFVHACEWNPHAVTALRKNLQLNGVSERCQVHEGDNRQLALCDVADRVNLGLIPSSEEGWPVACQVLKQEKGGVLHIHQNVESFQEKVVPCPNNHQQHLCMGNMYQEHNSANQQDQKSGTSASGDLENDRWGTVMKPEWQTWAESTEVKIGILLQDIHRKPWKTKILHIERVKSYAPHVDHMVMDLECRPLNL